MNEENIFGCFVSSGSSYYEDSQKIQNIAKEKGEIFRPYIYSLGGINSKIKNPKHKIYGTDLKLILFKFYVNPIPYLLEHLKEIENYRKNEKAIGIPIIINDENFFNKTEEERISFLKNAMLKKLDVLGELINRKKLDTNIKQLKTDLSKIFNQL